MTNGISLKELRERTGIDFVSSDIIKSNMGKSYDFLEKETESPTHKDMRNYGVEYFKKLGYQIYPEGIGVKNVFTFADFLAFREGRIIFVECLMDNNINDETIGKKSLLSDFGELCFVIVRGSGYRDTWVSDNHEIPDMMKKISARTDVLGFYYGHWKNDFEKKISAVTPFPKVSFNVKRDEPLKVQVIFKMKRKACDLYLSFITKPYLESDELEYIGQILLMYCFKLGRNNKELRFGGRWNLNSKSGIKFEDKNFKTIVSVKIINSTAILSAKEELGIKTLKEFIEFLRNYDFSVDYDENLFETCMNKLSASNSIIKDVEENPIESNLYETNQIVWVINHFFDNKPTQVSDFIKYLPKRIAHKINYWLTRGVELGELERKDNEEGLIRNRVYMATDNAIKHIKEDLNKTHYGEIPGKGRIVAFTCYVKHGDYLEGKI